jgi:hypothetical protein
MYAFGRRISLRIGLGYLKMKKRGFFRIGQGRASPCREMNLPFVRFLSLSDLQT